MEEMGQGYQANNSYQAMGPPQTPTYPQMAPYAASQGQYQNSFAPPQPAAPVMQPPQVPYTHQQPPPPPPSHSNYPPQPGMHIGQNYGYMQNQGYQQPHYEQPAPVRQEQPVEYAQPPTEYRRPSLPQTTQQYPGPSQMISPYSPMDQYNRSQQMNQQLQPLQTPNRNPSVSSASAMHVPTGHSLAPLKTLQPPTQPDKLEPVSPSYHSPPNSMSSGPMSAVSETANHSYMDTTRPPLPKFVPQAQPPPSSLGQKRSFSSTFDSKHLNDRLTQGARPNPAAPQYGYDGGYDEPDMEEPMDRSAMSYRRADGTHRQRHIPDLAA
jgi:hypothetical protein